MSFAANRRVALLGDDPSLRPHPDLEALLTERQREVLGAWATKRKAKRIAKQLGMSEGRVHQHLANIKQRLGVGDLESLYDADLLEEPYRISTGQESVVPAETSSRQSVAGVSPESMVLSDAMPLRHPAPWESDIYRVGPGAFDGPGAKLLMSAAIMAISLSIPLLLVILITARWAITAATAP